jgi:hypothetical protein
VPIRELTNVLLLYVFLIGKAFLVVVQAVAGSSRNHASATM